MEPADVISPAFWADTTPLAAGGGEFPSIPELDHHVLFKTSGSSGTPKWIALSKDALLASAHAVNRHLQVTSADCWGLALPLRHVGGFGVVARAYEAACRIVHFTPRWDAMAFSKWLMENQVTLTSLVPTQVHDLAAAQLRAPAGLRAIVVGGGRLDETIGSAARSLGWPVLASYGMTEAASQIATQPLASLHEIYQPAPIPLLPIWQAELAADGRLRIAGPALFSGTLSKSDGGWVFTRRHGDWHQTDDRVELHQGMLNPLGRVDTRVKVLGELVDLEEIEREILASAGGFIPPGSLVVVAVPDERAEHALVPVCDAALDCTMVRELLAAHASNAPGLFRLQPPVLLTNFPRSPLGKPLRSQVSHLVTAQNQARQINR